MHMPGSSICSRQSTTAYLPANTAFVHDYKRGVLLGYSRHLIDPERLTVPALLKAQGYHTAFFWQVAPGHGYAHYRWRHCG